jgi:hypothetical protein
LKEYYIIVGRITYYLQGSFIISSLNIKGVYIIFLLVSHIFYKYYMLIDYLINIKTIRNIQLLVLEDDISKALCFIE